MILGLLIFVAVWQSAQAQNQARIGFADPDILVVYLPESKTMQQQLQTYQKKLLEAGAAKENYLQTQIADYRAGVSVLSLERKAEMEKKIKEMQMDLQKYVAESEQKLALKQNELMIPILKKVNDAIEKVAKEKGLEIVLKTTGDSLHRRDQSSRYHSWRRGCPWDPISPGIICLAAQTEKWISSAICFTKKNPL